MVKAVTDDGEGSCMHGRKSCQVGATPQRPRQWPCELLRRRRGAMAMMSMVTMVMMMTMVMMRMMMIMVGMIMHVMRFVMRMVIMRMAMMPD